MSANFSDVFNVLQKIMRKYATHLDVVTTSDKSYYLNTTHIMKNKKPLFFGAVQVKKNYVSYHLMPVYVYPELLKSMSPELKRRMQGKSCFNFKSIDENVFKELDALTKAGLHTYKQEGYV